MNKLDKYYQKIKVLARLFFFGLTHKDATVKFAGTPTLDDSADVEVGKNSILQVGAGFSIRKNAIIAVRDNATLIIGSGVFVNRNTIILSRQNITIGNRVTIGPNVCIYDHDHDLRNGGGGYATDNISIMDNVWIGSNVTILKGVTIGENSVIASGCIVTKNIPANTILIQKRISTEIQR